MLNEEQRESLRNKTVDVLLAMRAAYLRTSRPNVLRHWDMLQDRMRAAARTTSSPEEWVTETSRRWQLGSPNSDCSAALRSLADEVRERGASREWLDLVEAEYGYLMAMARSIAEQRKESLDV